ncbi:hypothetical protein IJ096_00840, partial [Candidatus Saccharibacteria bacterium]|nr:hypothetical protein [Candidatus Saccharibacteria bacterium]
MVLKPSNGRSRGPIIFRNVAIFFACMIVAYIAMRIVIGQTLTGFVQQNIIPAISAESKTPNFIDMQNLIDDFAKPRRGDVSIVIYDIDNDRYSALYNSDASMNIASLYKLLPTYINYLGMEEGTLSKTDVLYTENKNDKKVEYTREKCAELTLRESHSGCAEAMVKEIGQETLDLTGWQEYDLTNTFGLSSTAGDITKLMKTYYTHTGLSAETWSKIKDTLLVQPPTKEDKTENNWRQGLPSGFHTAKVYNKVGWQGEKDKW